MFPPGLSVSRVFGDIKFKDPAYGKVPNSDILIARPDITTTEIKEEDEFIILASDGLWDVISPEKAIKFVRKDRKKQLISPTRSATSLCDLAYRAGSGDNITCIIVYFTHHQAKWNRSPRRDPGW